VDYDQTDMPENYDRGRTPPPGVMDMWMQRIAAAVGGHGIATIIDLGCGTGRFTGPLAQRFGADVTGIDPSEKMLAQARAKPLSARVKFLKGSGEEIPCPAASADLVFSSMAFHHFRSPGRVSVECRRVLRKEGLVCIRNSTRNGTPPYERFFPNYRRSLDKLPAVAEITAAFTENGFSLRSHEAVPHMMAANVRDLAEKAAFRADTTLQRLSDEDFQAGLENMRAPTKDGSEPMMIDIDLFVFAKGGPQ
jgi:ubiquinone/menaquinone biosynthesis C-methylase UbiE